MIIFKLITSLVALVTLGLTGYLYQLLDKTDYLEQAATISGESALTFHIAAAVVIAWLIFCLIKKVISTALLVTILIVALGVEGSFLSMNLNGSIIEITEESAQEVFDSAKETFKEGVDELKHKIEN